MPSQPPPPVEVQHLFLPERESLLAVLTALTEDEWARPTACPGWTVKDVALHLLGVDLGNLSVRRDDFGDPWWKTAKGGLADALNQFNETWVMAARRISPRLLCDLLAFTGDQIGAYFGSLDPDAIGGPVSWAGPEPAPVWLDIAREYTERWVHQQQIRDAVGRPGLKEPRSMAPVLATFVHALPHTLRDTPAPSGTALRLIIEGEAGGTWIAERTRERWALVQDRAGPAEATVGIDQDIAWRLFTRGIARDQAHARLEGNRDLGMKVLEVVSIIA